MAKLIVGVNDLATVNPELAKEWDYEKNEKTPQDYTASSHVKAWWNCKKGHEYQARISNRNQINRGCPYCSNQKVLKGFNDLVTTNPDIAKEWDYEKNKPIKPEEVLRGSSKKYWWICKICGFNWLAKINHRSSGHGCPNCKRLKAKNTVYAIKGVNDLATLRPNLALEWNFEKNTIFPYEVTLGSEKNVWWKCRSGHEWQSIVSNRVKGSDCPYCSGRKAIVGVNDLATVNPKLAEEWNYEKNKGLVDGDGNDISLPTLILARSKQKVWWICNKKHEWKSTVVNRTIGNGCPYCSGSKTERLSYQILKELNIPFVAEKKFSQDMYISFYPYDIWIASKKLIIELDGIQHFQELKYFEEQQSLNDRRKTDNLKNNYCLTKGIPILRIPYTYNPDTEKEKIKSMIKDFIETRKIPQEIIDFYEQYKENNNYAEIARKINEQGLQ